MCECVLGGGFWVSGARDPSCCKSQTCLCYILVTGHVLNPKTVGTFHTALGVGGGRLVKRRTWRDNMVV